MEIFGGGWSGKITTGHVDIYGGRIFQHTVHEKKKARWGAAVFGAQQLAEQHKQSKGRWAVVQGIGSADSNARTRMETHTQPAHQNFDDNEQLVKSRTLNIGAEWSHEMPGGRSEACTNKMLLRGWQTALH